MATAMIQAEEEPSCPICLGLFNIPRQLPCAHTFCQSCLQNYIATECTKHEKLRYIECPVCKKTAGHFKQNKPTDEWASLFPADIVLQSMLRTKSKVERMCDACNSEGVSVTASGFCAVCEEAMCNDCLKVHRKLKKTRIHTILTIEELLSNPHNVIKFAKFLTCFEHDGEELKFYCKNHTVACCGICFLESHKTCSNVKTLKEELISLLRDTKPSEIIEELKSLETHLKKFMDENESSVNDLESQVNGLSNQIGEMRMKINAALEELEVTVKAEGNRIYKEFAIRKQEENHKCLSLVHAVRNSYVLCETVHKYGADMQQFVIAEKIKSQLPSYYTEIREKYERTDTMTVQVEFAPLVESILSLSPCNIRRLVTMTSSTLSIHFLRTPIKDVRIKRVETINVNINGDVEPLYTDVTILPRDRVILLDKHNRQCILLNHSYELVTRYTLTKPCNICVVDDEEVAVSLYDQHKIQILSVRDDVISQVRTIRTKHKCYGIAAAGKGEMIVVVDCGNNTFCWSLIRDRREVKSSDQFYSPSGFFSYIALDNSKTRVYVTVHGTNSLHCFNMDGKMQYTYSPDNLKHPKGVAVDRDDNIYVIGCRSHNIHQLSPDGSVLQIITTGVPHYPWAISFDTSRDTFVITNNFDRKKLHIYRTNDDNDDDDDGDDDDDDPVSL